MHVQTHIMSGWCVGNVLGLTPRERLFSMVAASVADLDGLGILLSREAYWNYHHKLGHNLAFAVLFSSILAAFSNRRLFVFAVYMGMAHLHLLLDYFGSGPGWPLYYFWPFTNFTIEYRSAWEFYSWQNISAAGALLAITLYIAIRHGRTPLETIMPHLDQELVRWLRKYSI